MNQERFFEAALHEFTRRVGFRYRDFPDGHLLVKGEELGQQAVFRAVDAATGRRTYIDEEALQRARQSNDFLQSCVDLRHQIDDWHAESLVNFHQKCQELAQQRRVQF